MHPTAKNTLQWIGLPLLVHCSSDRANSSATAFLDGGLGSPADDGSCATDTSLDAGLRTYGPYDSHIQYIGRIDVSDPAGPWLIESATCVTARFRGNVAAIELNDNASGGADFFDVVVDDGGPFTLAPVNGSSSWYGLSTSDAAAPVGIGCGEHTLTIVKRTEATVGTTQVLGFQFAEALSLPAGATAPHRMEFIGDSLLCGYGVAADSPDAEACSDNGLGQPGYGQGVEDGRLAFGVVMASILGAEWHVTCESGVGLVRNTDNGYIDPRPMPVLYPLLHPETTDNPTLWPPNQWAMAGGAPVQARPDVVVIELGGNDLSVSTADGGQRPPIAVGSPSDAPDAAPSLAHGFLQFIPQLAADFPGATFVLAQNAPEVQSAIDIVVAYYADGGAGAAANVRVVGFADGLPYPGAGCDGHPNATQQAAAGARMAIFVKALMGWQ